MRRAKSNGRVAAAPILRGFYPFLKVIMKKYSKPMLPRAKPRINALSKRKISSRVDKLFTERSILFALWLIGGRSQIRSATLV
jgi:hypothetical protein